MQPHAGALHWRITLAHYITYINLSKSETSIKKFLQFTLFYILPFFIEKIVIINKGLKI